jgi:protein-tyrosine phosphatase
MHNYCPTKIKTTSGTLYIGPAPIANDLEMLPKFDIIWNLASELKSMENNELYFCDKVLLADIEDRSIPKCKNIIKFQNQLEEVVNVLHDGGCIFVHCVGGIGRTGMALACIKNKLDLFLAADALYFAKENCGGPETIEQANFVLEFCK